MITVVFSTRTHNKSHIDHLKKSSGLGKNIEVIEYINNGEYSLTELYNKGLKESKNELVIFCHDDIIFETKNWGTKLNRVIKKNDDFGIIGIAGSRELPKSGQWWENPNHMYGQVYHQHEGKKWLSKYSDKKIGFIDNVVLVDGLFFAVRKSMLKCNFDESIKGFHFYEVDFCFRNFLQGVKIGVTSDIDVTHLSIGMTNEEWDENRKIFAEKYKNNLPIKCNKDINNKNKLKVLIGCLFFRDYTGSELHVYELAKELSKKNCEVHIVSQLGDKMVKRIKKYGVRCFDLTEPPGYKLGDGRWGVKGVNGFSPSEKGKLYKIKDIKYDVLHVNHKPVGDHLIKAYPNIPVINTIHSEVIPKLEEPVLHDNVKKYIAIRPEIKNYIESGWDVNEDKIKVIYNPIDGNRFKHYKNENKNVTLFVGTIDYLRKETILDLIEYTKENNKELWLVGEKKDEFINDINEDHVKYYPPTWDVEKYVKECDETASILLGRTTIEGWLCGKPGWIYEVESSGYILSKKKHEVPQNINTFKSENIASQIFEEYKTII